MFLAHFKNEADKPLEDIRAVAEEIETDKADLVISTMVYAELLDIVTDPSLRDAFNRFRRRRNVRMIDVNPRIAELSQDVAVSAKQIQRSIKPPDAIVVATALLHKADVLHTFDDRILKASAAGLWVNLKVCHPRLLSGQKLLSQIFNPKPVTRNYPSHLGRGTIVSRFGEKLSGLALASSGNLSLQR